MFELTVRMERFISEMSLTPLFQKHFTQRITKIDNEQQMRTCTQTRVNDAMDATNSLE